MRLTQRGFGGRTLRQGSSPCVGPSVGDVAHESVRDVADEEQVAPLDGAILAGSMRRRISAESFGGVAGPELGPDVSGKPVPETR